jgi:hypothetical protein
VSIVLLQTFEEHMFVDRDSQIVEERIESDLLEQVTVIAFLTI